MGNTKKTVRAGAPRQPAHEYDDALAGAKRLHARGCRGITKAAAAWRDLSFTEKLVWMNLAGSLKRGAR